MIMSMTHTEILHRYLNQTHPRSNPKNSLWFEGKILFSYKLPIARHTWAGLLIRQADSTRTTNQHISMVMMNHTIHHVVLDVMIEPERMPVGWWLDRINRYIKLAKRARVNRQLWCFKATRELQLARQFSNSFNLRWVVEEPEELTVLKVRLKLTT